MISGRTLPSGPDQLAAILRGPSSDASAASRRMEPTAAAHSPTVEPQPLQQRDTGEQLSAALSGGAHVWQIGRRRDRQNRQARQIQRMLSMGEVAIRRDLAAGPSDRRMGMNCRLRSQVSSGADRQLRDQPATGARCTRANGSALRRGAGTLVKSKRPFQRHPSGPGRSSASLRRYSGRSAGGVSQHAERWLRLAGGARPHCAAAGPVSSTGSPGCAVARTVSASAAGVWSR